MKKIFPVILLCITAVNAIQKENFARFHRILKKFDYANYRVSDKDIYTDFLYSSKLVNSRPYQDDIIEGFNRRVDFTRDIQGKAGFKGEWISSTPLKQFDCRFQADFNGSSSENAQIAYYPLLGLYDTNELKRRILRGNVNVNPVYERHFNTDVFKDFPYIAIHGNVSFNGEDNVSQSFQHFDSSYVMVSQSKYKEQSIITNADLYPGVGLGRKRPVKPVYQAFEIERIMRDAGLIKDALSDKSILSLSQALASLNAAKLKNDLYKKNIMQRLETILKQDSAVNDSLLGAFILFKIDEIFETPYPDFYAGGAVELNLHGNCGYKMNKNSYYISDYKGYDSEKNSDFSVDYSTSVQAYLSYPVIPRLFLSLTFNYDTYSPYLNGAYHFFITNRLLSSAGANVNWNREFSYRDIEGFLKFRFYIEDHISVSCTLNKSIRHENYWSSIRNKESSENISLGLNYDL